MSSLVIENNIETICRDFFDGIAINGEKTLEKKNV